jgi:hypothetical protein
MVYNNEMGSRRIKDTAVISGGQIIHLQPLLILMNRLCKMSIFERDQMDQLYKFSKQCTATAVALFSLLMNEENAEIIEERIAATA